VYWAVNTVWLNSGGAEEIPPSCSLSLPCSCYFSLSISCSLVCFLFSSSLFHTFLECYSFLLYLCVLTRPCKKTKRRANHLPLSLPWKMSRYLSSRKLVALVPCPRWYIEFYANFRLMECVIASVVWYKRSVMKLEVLHLQKFYVFWISKKIFLLYIILSVWKTCLNYCYFTLFVFLFHQKRNIAKRIITA